jgi:hypothetical protein
LAHSGDLRATLQLLSIYFDDYEAVNGACGAGGEPERPQA